MSNERSVIIFKKEQANVKCIKNMNKELEKLLTTYDLDNFEENPDLGDIHPIHKKHCAASWQIQDVYGYLYTEQISRGKARELTSGIIEYYQREDKEVSIEIKEEHYTCGDGCCDMWEDYIYINGQRYFAENKEDLVEAFKDFLKKEGYKVE